MKQFSHLKIKSFSQLSILLLFSLIFNSSIAQNIEIIQDTTAITEMDSTKNDSTTSVVFKKHSPGKAALYSALLPGGGQAYNKKYWKIPVIYTGFAGLGTWMGLTIKDLNGYKNALKLHYDGDPSGSYKGISDEAQLQIKRQEKRKNLDLTIIFTSIWYAINIIDAAVDAHLYEYNVTEDISVSIDPAIQMYQAQNGAIQPTGGLSFKLNFK